MNNDLNGLVNKELKHSMGCYQGVLAEMIIDYQTKDMILIGGKLDFKKCYGFIAILKMHHL